MKLIFSITPLFLFILVMTSPTALHGEVIQATLNDLQISVDTATGSIVRLSYPAIGVMLEARPESAGLLEVAYPIQEFVPMRLASRFSKALITEEKDSLSITWDSLGPSRSGFKLPEGKVSATVTMQAANDGRSVILKCRIENHSSAPVPQILFPDLWGLKDFEGAGATQLRFPGGMPANPFLANLDMSESSAFYATLGWYEYPPTGGYRIGNALRWLDMGGYRGGLSVFQKTWAKGEWPTVRTRRSDADPSSLRLNWEYKSGVKPGDTWESDEIWLTPHRGGWAKGIEVFRDYVKQMHPPRELPKHIRDGIGFQTVWMMQSTEPDPARAAFRWPDLPRVAADAKEHGLDELNIWGWCDYFTIPIPLRKELGTREEFFDAMHKAKEMGVNVSLFSSFMTVWVRDFAKRYGGGAGEPAWVYHPDMIPRIDPYYIKNGPLRQYMSVFFVDVHQKEFREDVLAALKEWIDAGVTSFSWDQYIPDAPNSDPPGATDLALQIRKMARAKDPDSVLSGEQNTSYEYDSGVLDYTWNWIDYYDVQPLISVLSSPRLNCGVDSSPRVVKLGFIDNQYLNVMPRKPDDANGTALVSERPALAAALKEVAVLRKQFLPYFVEGTFIGDSVLSAPNGGVVRGYQLGPKLLVIALNQQSQATTLTIKSPLDLWLPAAKSYQVKSFSGDGKLQETSDWDKPEWTVTTKSLQPLELVLFEIEAR